MDSVVYLGYKVDHQGLHIIETTTNAIQNAPTPKNVPELKSFPGVGKPPQPLYLQLCYPMVPSVVDMEYERTAFGLGYQSGP